MMERINNWLYHHPEFCDLATVLAPLLFIFLLMICMNSCSTIKEVPIQYIDRVEYKDTTIYIKDTIKIEVPKEVVKEVIPQVDTSYLETSVASSIAYLDTAKRSIYHKIQQKGHIDILYDTLVTVQYVDRYIEKEVPVIQTVDRYKRDTLFWISVIFNVIILMYIAFKIYLKIKL